jgi:hypothetical protein
MNKNDSIRTDTEEDALSSLELAAEFLIQAKNDDRYWKWYITALHSGLQGLFALLLKNIDWALLQKKDVAIAYLKANQARRSKLVDNHAGGIEDDPIKYPEPKMDFFLELYNKCLLEITSHPLKPKHKKAVEHLNEDRNDFIHFNAKSWGIERERIYEYSDHSCEIAEFIVLKSYSIQWHQESHLQRATGALERLRNALLAAKL